MYVQELLVRLIAVGMDYITFPSLDTYSYQPILIPL
jgi:hypothetical protein